MTSRQLGRLPSGSHPVRKASRAACQSAGAMSGRAENSTASKRVSTVFFTGVSGSCVVVQAARSVRVDSRPTRKRGFRIMRGGSEFVKNRTHYT